MTFRVIVRIIAVFIIIERSGDRGNYHGNKVLLLSVNTQPIEGQRCHALGILPRPTWRIPWPERRIAARSTFPC